MKHSIKVVILLISMFLITQLIGLAVINQYSPVIKYDYDSEGNVIEKTTFNLPYGTDPPENQRPQGVLNAIISFAVIFTISILLMLSLMKYGAELILKIWFFLVVVLAIGITTNSVLLKVPYNSLIAILISIPLAYMKIIKRNIIAHNLTELLIYPGIAAIFVSLLLSWVAHPILVSVLILVLISIYDIYAVWHAGFMQKMAEYQITKLKFFTGFFVPYLGKKEKDQIKKIKAQKSAKKSKKEEKIQVNVAILGGGDVIFPIILAGTVLHTLGWIQALIISIGATLSLAWLFYISKKGKFYPAMPFISTGCLIALGIAYLI